MLEDLRQTEGVVGEIRRLLANSRGRYPSIKEAAASLAVSERTLRRRLAKENITYKQVALDFRMELTASYLRGAEISIQEIAFVTGYADPSNFHRTFARHTGMTPIAYRQHYQRDHASPVVKDR